MNNLLLVLRSADSIEPLTVLAYQYGPFLFALLYMLLIPIIASKMYISLLKEHITDKGTGKRAFDNYNFYFRLSAWCGVILVLCTVVWWLYLQSQLLQRDYVYQGTIVNADEEDYFHRIAADQRVYFDRQVIDHHVEWKFAIVTDKPLPKDFEISVRYLNQKAISDGEGGNLGGDNITLKIPDKNKRVFSIQFDQNKGLQLVALSGVNEYVD